MFVTRLNHPATRCRKCLRFPSRDGITKSFLPATTRAIAHVTDADIAHPGIAAVRAAHAGFAEVGFKSAEEPIDDVPVMDGDTGGTHGAVCETFRVWSSNEAPASDGADGAIVLTRISAKGGRRTKKASR